MFLHSKNSQPANVHGCTFAGKASALSLVQRSTSVYFAEHKFDRCQTCFCLIRAASVPLLKMLDVQKVRLRFISARLLASAPPICKSAGFAEAAGMPLVISEAMFQHRWNSLPKVYKDVHFWQCNAVDGMHIFKRPCIFRYLPLYYFYAEFQNRIITVSIIFSQRTKKDAKGTWHA